MGFNSCSVFLVNRVDKKRDKLERKVLDSQERAFWDVHRPVPGCVNTTEVDIKKACRMNKPLITTKVSFMRAHFSYGSYACTMRNLRNQVSFLRENEIDMHMATAVYSVFSRIYVYIVNKKRPTHSHTNIKNTFVDCLTCFGKFHVQ